MKRILFLLCINLFLLGCRDDRIELPKVTANPSQLSLTSDHTTDHFILSADPPVILEWSLSYKPDWLDVSPASGPVDGMNAITVTAKTSTLLPQLLNDKIVITTTTGKVEIPVSLNITRSIAVQLSPAPLLVDYNENSKSVIIKNNSSQTVNWQLEPSATYFSITPASGTLAANQTSTLTLAVNRSTLDTKIYAETLALKIGGVNNSTFPVSINNFKEEKWILDGAVTDAEYDRTGDNLIVIIGSKLYKLKPETKTAVTVDLPLPGTCVSVGQNGQYAAVGHDAWVSLVNLSTMTLVQTYPVTANALDVVLAPNNWAYIFPKVDQWQNIRCINLATGTEMLNTGRQIYAGTKAKLHPSGNYIYGANNGLSPSDAEKYDISGGQANFLYDSPYHGQYEFSGNLWMADNGTKMFTRGRTVFNLSTNQASDMTYAGTLAGSSAGVETLDHISSRNLVYAVYYDYSSQTPQNEIKIFSGDFLNSLGTKPIPGFLITQAGGFQLVPSEGKYGFFNSAGTKFFICVKSKTITGVPVQWAVATINVN
ncbi:MAG TPA: hypothetical protein VF144_14245 [Chitinophagaceae bacterium]